MRSIFLAALVVAATTSAQQTSIEQQARRGPANNDFSYLNLTFAGRHATDCGALSNENNTFDLYIHSLPTSRVCFGMTVNTYFMNDTDANLTIIDQNSNSLLEGYQAPEQPCPDGRDDCGVRYSLTRASNFNTSTWYEQNRYGIRSSVQRVARMMIMTGLASWRSGLMLVQIAFPDQTYIPSVAGIASVEKTNPNVRS